MMSSNQAPINEIYLAGIVPTLLLVLFPFLYLISKQTGDVEYSINFEKLTAQGEKKTFFRAPYYPNHSFFIFFWKIDRKRNRGACLCMVCWLNYLF